ncbi:helix-turn-helix domain-containing protein [Acuticoccus sediminis]|uniref:helix-turn-helix domain-containing protein n=1 Tax=Acuticoccus sediminis TaxID=2184697 RepID=UPI001CFD4A86|nr:XRE family transcriptional regulator [Acuticoccus sediminis]
MDGVSGENGADPYDRRVGQRIRERRKARRMTLEDVASACGISTAQLSMIERGLASPSVKGLREICRTLDINLLWLFEEEADRGPEAGLIVRRHRRKHFDLAQKKMHKELLTPDFSGRLQFLWIEMQPGSSSGPDPYAHDGEETGLVLEGRMSLVVDGAEFILDEGDSFRFESHRPHRFSNAGDTLCKVIWVCTPPFY